MSETRTETAELPELLSQLAEYEAAMAELLSVLESEASTEESFARTAQRLVDFGPLVERLEQLERAGQLRGAGPQFDDRLKTVRLRHGLLFQAARRKQGDLAEALAQVREVRRSGDFYRPDGPDTGSSCDISG